MIRTLLASTAIATTLGFAALAQDTSDPLVEPGTDVQAPAEVAPAAPAIEAEGGDAVTPMEPATDTAQDPAATPMEPAIDTADDPAATPMDPAIDTADDPAATPMDPAVDTAQDPAAPGMMAPGTDTAAERVLTPVVAAEISASALIGASIETPDGQNIASVDDVLMNPDGQLESVVAQFGGFLGFGSSKVLLTPDEIEVLQDEAGTFVVQTALTPEALEGRPEYTTEQ